MTPVIIAAVLLGPLAILVLAFALRTLAAFLALVAGIYLFVLSLGARAVGLCRTERWLEVCADSCMGFSNRAWLGDR